MAWRHLNPPPTCATLEAQFGLSSTSDGASILHSPELVDGVLRCGCARCAAWSSYVKGPPAADGGPGVHPKYLVLTAELVDLLARWLRSQRHALVGSSAELRILEVGAGSGALTAALKNAFRDEPQIQIAATDSYARELVRVDGLVGRLPYEEALRVYAPQIVLCAWMPLGDDWTAAFRAAPSVSHYVLLGEVDDGCCGQPWKTWGYLAADARDDTCSVPSTSSEDDDDEEDGGGGGGGDAGRGEGWRRVWEHRPEATPFGADGWARRELPELSKVLLGCTDEPWLAARRSKAVLFSRGASLLLTGGVREEVARWLG